MTAFSGYYNYFVLGMMICDFAVNTKAVDCLVKNIYARIACIIIGYILLSMIELNDSDKYTRIVFAIGIALFMIGVLSSNVMEKILGNKVMLAGGKIAYSAYIVHWPIIETLSCSLILMFYKLGILCNGVIWGVFFATFIAVVIVAKFITDNIEPIGTRIAQNLTI